jgi:hypothetical protein
MQYRFWAWVEVEEGPTSYQQLELANWCPMAKLLPGLVPRLTAWVVVPLTALSKKDPKLELARIPAAGLVYETVEECPLG